jgi:hypothetical protein
MQFSHLGTSLKFRRVRNRALAFPTTHEQPFPLHYRGIGDLPSVDLEAKTSEVRRDKVRTIGQ